MALQQSYLTTSQVFSLVCCIECLKRPLSAFTQACRRDWLIEAPVLHIVAFWMNWLVTFLPRCMECRRGLAMRILSVRLSVRLSVCPSVCQTRALWQNGRKICLDFYIIRKNVYDSFLRRRMVGGGDPFYLKFWVNRVGAKSPILDQ